jgi:hypothetical protein
MITGSDLEYICSIKIVHEGFRKNSVTLVFSCSSGCLFKLSIESTGILRIHKSTRTAGKSSILLMKILILIVCRHLNPIAVVLGNWYGILILKEG